MSLVISSARSSLVARGRRDAALLTPRLRAESKEQPSGLRLDVPGVSQDYVEAAKWYREAAEQGDAQAQYSFGQNIHAARL